MDETRGSGLPTAEELLSCIDSDTYGWHKAVKQVKEALDRKDADKRGSQQRRIEMQQEEIAALEERNAEFRKSEKELSDSYLRIRTLVNAFNTNKGGKNRFEVTEKKITELKAERDLLREKVRKAEEALRPFAEHWLMQSEKKLTCVESIGQKIISVEIEDLKRAKSAIEALAEIRKEKP